MLNKQDTLHFEQRESCRMEDSEKKHNQQSEDLHLYVCLLHVETQEVAETCLTALSLNPAFGEQ